MIWLAWRRQRLTVLATLGLGALAVAGILALRIAATSYMEEHGIAGCATAGPGCDFNVMNQFAEAFGGFQAPLILLMFALPPLVGAFTGGPLFAREIERGTHIFALTQSVGRTRWWAAKILVGALPVVAATLTVGLIATWAVEPLAYITASPLRTPGFETQGTVFAAYTLLAFAVGSTAGMLLRNTLAAMVVTIVFYIAMLVTVGSLVREDYAEALVETESVNLEVEKPPAHLDSWQIDYGYLNADGEEVDFRMTAGCGEVDQCMAAEGITDIYMVYHPAERFWRFQLTETALFASAAALAVGVGALAVRRVRN